MTMKKKRRRIEKRRRRRKANSFHFPYPIPRSRSHFISYPSIFRPTDTLSKYQVGSKAVFPRSYLILKKKKKTPCLHKKANPREDGVSYRNDKKRKKKGEKKNKRQKSRGMKKIFSFFMSAQHSTSGMEWRKKKGKESSRCSSQQASQLLHHAS